MSDSSGIAVAVGVPLLLQEIPGSVPGVSIEFRCFVPGITRFGFMMFHRRLGFGLFFRWRFPRLP